MRDAKGRAPLITILGIVIIYHLIIYIFYFKRKEFAKKYVKFLTVSAIVFCLIAAVSFISKDFILFLMLILTATYYYVIFCIHQSTTLDINKGNTNSPQEIKDPKNPEL